MLHQDSYMRQVALVYYSCALFWSTTLVCTCSASIQHGLPHAMHLITGGSVTSSCLQCYGSSDPPVVGNAVLLQLLQAASQ